MVFERKAQNDIRLPTPHSAVRKALLSTGQSWGSIGKATGYSRAYICNIANGKTKLTSRAVKRLTEKLPQLTSLFSHCPTCGQTLPISNKPTI